MLKIENVVAYIDKMFDRQHYESQWVDENDSVVGTTDIGYAYECWKDFMKDELISVFGEGNSDD